MEPADHELMARVCERDAPAFELLFSRYRDPVRRHLAQIVRDEDAAHDLLQEVFVRVWTHAGQWDARGPVRAWLFRSATNRALSYLRAPRHRRERSLDSPPCAAMGAADEWLAEPLAHGPDLRTLAAEGHAQLRRLVARLPADKRIVWHMVYDEELDAREVAEALGIPLGTVKSRLHYARKWLARAWAKLEAAHEK